MDAVSIKSHRDQEGGVNYRQSKESPPEGPHRETGGDCHRHQEDPCMARLVSVCLLLLPSPGWAQSTLRAQQDVGAPAPRGAPAPPPRAESPPHFPRSQPAGHLTGETTYDHLHTDHNKVGLFVAAAAGTMTLMAVVYCIYNKFYTKQQYLHTQLQDDSELTLDLPDNPSMTAPCGRMGDGRERPGGYGSLSATPSVISIPPSLTPPPHVSPFPPLYRSTYSLRTISAKDLERSFL